MSGDTEPYYLTTEEVADLLRTPVATIYAWRHRSEAPPCRKVGKRLLWRRDEVIAWIEETK